MTSKQIEVELRKIYPSICIVGPIHCISLHGPNYNEWWIETNVVPEQHRHLAEGRTPKKAWLEAWRNKDKYKELAGIAEAVKEVYPEATWYHIRINNWKEHHTIGSTSKPFTECEEESDFITGSGTLFNTPDDAWIAAYNKIKNEKETVQESRS